MRIGLLLTILFPFIELCPDSCVDGDDGIPNDGGETDMTPLEAAQESHEIMNSIIKMGQADALDYLSGQANIDSSGSSSDGTTIWFHHIYGGTTFLDYEEDPEMMSTGIAELHVSDDNIFAYPVVQPVKNVIQNAQFELTSTDGMIDDLKNLNQNAHLLYFHGHSPVVTIDWLPEESGATPEKIETAIFITNVFGTIEEVMADPYNEFLVNNGYLAKGMLSIEKDDFVLTERYYWGVTPTFFRDIWEGGFNNNPLVYFASCSQGKFSGEKSMAGVFLKKGAGVFLGWSNKTNRLTLNQTDKYLFQFLLDDMMSVEEALNQKPNPLYGYFGVTDSSLVSIPPSSDFKYCTDECFSESAACNEEGNILETCIMNPQTGCLTVVETECAAGCIDGDCCEPDCEGKQCGANDGCGGLCLYEGFCNNPPDDYCVDDIWKRYFEESGECNNGECDYSYTDLMCRLGCNLDKNDCRSENDTDPDIPTGCEGAITFLDDSLEVIVRDEIGIPNGAIYYEDVKNVNSLNGYNTNIVELSGIQCFTGLSSLSLAVNNIGDISELATLENLTSLSLGSNSISDISALSNLPNITYLQLGGNNITDISALSNMNDIAFLTLEGNNITDISALENLNKLTDLLLSFNDISDVSPLSNLTDLAYLYLDNNSVSDISAFSNLTNLRYLWIDKNNVSDIFPLVANEGIDSGDNVKIENNLLDCDDDTTLAHISVIESRGVNLDHDCQ